ncbi:hypothetical protein N0V86_001449 [Didymella sp. IMI 355093]|nr:hypothetical protein N0V86_001449 [Didymella sp. IMI 355093]
MDQSPPADPEWITMRERHQQECAAFVRQVEADKQTLAHRQEAERGDFNRHVETIKAELLGRHSQQEGAYWIRHHQKQSKVCSLAASMPPPPHQGPTSTTQTTPLRPSATPATVMDRNPMPKPEPAMNPSLSKAFNEQKQKSQKVTAVSAVQQPAKQASKQAPIPRHGQQKGIRDAVGASQPTKPEQPRQNTVTPRTRTSLKKDVETIDLCSSDDDMLAEVSKADYQKTDTPAVAPFRPAIPTATLQLLGGLSQKQAVSSNPSLMSWKKPDTSLEVRER